MYKICLYATICFHFAIIKGEVIGLASVEIRFNDLERAIKMLKRKLQKEGVFKVLKLKRFAEKPSEAKKRKKEESVKRRHKLRKKARLENW